MKSNRPSSLSRIPNTHKDTHPSPQELALIVELLEIFCSSNKTFTIEFSFRDESDGIHGIQCWIVVMNWQVNKTHLI